MWFWVNRWLYVAVGVGVLSMAILYQRNTITALKADNQQQAELIEQQYQAISQLKADTLKNTEILNALTKQESMMREKANETINSLENKNDNCAYNNAPHAAIEFLRQ